MTKDFIALMFIGAGSTYARGPDAEKAIADCASRAVRDWSSLYDLAGQEAEIGLYDVTGYIRLSFGYNGVKVRDEGEHNGKVIEPVEIREVTLPKKRK